MARSQSSVFLRFRFSDPSQSPPGPGEGPNAAPRRDGLEDRRNEEDELPPGLQAGLSRGGPESLFRWRTDGAGPSADLQRHGHRLLQGTFPPEWLIAVVHQGRALREERPEHLLPARVRLHDHRPVHPGVCPPSRMPLPPLATP